MFSAAKLVSRWVLFFGLLFFFGFFYCKQDVVDSLPLPISAVTADPAVPHSASLRPLSAVTGAKQHCFRTCRELVKRRWVWNQEKGQRPKTFAPRVLSLPHAVTSRLCGWNIEHVVKPPPNKTSKSFLKCVCLFLKGGFWLEDMLLRHLM